MQFRLLANIMLLVAAATSAWAAPPVELELATEQGLQITAPHEWLQLLAGAGIDNVRIRAAAGGERPRVENVGTDQRPSYRVVGLLSARQELQLPGGTFRRNDLARLKDYLNRLTAEGPEAVTARRGRFGLTEKELAAVLADLAQPIDFPTKGQPPRTVVNRLGRRLSLAITIDANADRALGTAEPLPDDVQGLTTGTGLAIMLRGCGLALRPEKEPGRPVALRIVATDAKTDAWPVGWEPEQAPGQLAPSLFERVSVAVDGYTLRETLEAIGPRVKMPYFWDHAALAEHQIDPDTVKVTLPRTRTFYKRVLDRVLAQAQLGAKLRVDEAGTAFLWITR